MDINHEAYIAGALLMSPEHTLAETRGLLTAESFADPLYRAVYAAAAELDAEGTKADAAVIKDRVNRNGVSLTNELCRDLMSGCPTLQALGFYAERVAQAADGRNLRAILYDAAERLGNGDNVGSVRAELEAELAHVKARGAGGLVSSSEAMQRCYEGLMSASAGERLFVPSGYGRLNRILGGGFIKGGLHILAARPGTGKTTLALQIAENVAAKGIKTLFISLEMSIDQLQHRRLAVDAGMPLGDILGVGEQDAEAWQKIYESTKRLNIRPLLFNRMPGLSVERIERLARSSEAGFLVIDYLGLIRHQGGKSIYERVTETSNALKRMAVALNVPVLCLCQLNRGADGKQPQLSELRDSGAIEQDADTVTLQWLPGGRPEDEGMPVYAPVELQCIVAKNRHGAQGKLSLDWYMACGRIRE